MTDPKANLKKRFENGALPNGDDFATLIDFFTPERDFKAHLIAFEDLKTAPDVTLGTEGKGWTMSLDATQTRVWLAPDAHKPQPKKNPSDPPTHVEADVGLYGWVGMGGRVGTLEGPLALQGATSELAGRMPEAAIFKSDGTSHTLFHAPGRPCVLEVVAATNRATAEKPPVLARAKRFIGFAAPDNAVLHAIARTTAGQSTPTVTISGAPRSWPRALGIVLLIFALLIAIMGHFDPQLAPAAQNDAAVAEVQTGTPGAGTENAASTGANTGSEVSKLEADAEKIIAKVLKLADGALSRLNVLFQELLKKIGVDDPSKNVLGIIALVIAALAGAIFVNRARNRAANAINLKWVRTGAKSSAGADQYRLEITGPDLTRLGGNTDLYVHVTRLWA